MAYQTSLHKLTSLSLKITKLDTLAFILHASR